jgi:hypothetical protein
MSGIRIRRDANMYADRRRRYQVLVDDHEVGSVGRGEMVDIPLAPGAYTVRLKIDWTGSEMATFTLGPEETVEFVCRPRYSAAAIHLALFRSIWRRDDWIVLEPT